MFPLPSVAGQLVHFEGIQGCHCPLWLVSWYILKGFPLPPVAGQFVHFEGIQGSHCPLWPVSWYILKGFPLPPGAGHLVQFEGNRVPTAIPTPVQLVKEEWIQGFHWFL